MGTNSSTRAARGPGARKPARSQASAAVVQGLESRRLLSTVNVMMYGAIPNDGVDDRAAIMSAINASAPGDTILFSGGTYNVSDAINIKGAGRIYQGDKGGKIARTSGNRVIFFLTESNVTIQKLTLEGSGLETQGVAGARIEGLVVDNVIFNITGGGHNNGIEFNTGLKNSRITNNTFNIGGENGIYGYNWDNLVIANNEFLNGGEGIHIIAHSDASKDLLVEQNYFSGLRRMGIELQGGGYRTIVQDNYYENPVMTSNFADNMSTFAYSIITDRGVDMIVRRNTALQPQRPDGTGVRIIFELGGKNLLAYDNYSVGGNHVVACTGTSATGWVRDNRFSDYLRAPSNANGAQVQFSNNGPNVALSWDINRGRPRPNARYDGSTGNPGGEPGDEPTGENPGGGPIDDPGDEPSVKPCAPSQLVGTAVGTSQANLIWVDNSTNETGFRIERLADDGVTWSYVGKVAANVTTYLVSNLSAGGTYQFRVRAYSLAGDSSPSNVATVRVPLPVRTDSGGGVQLKPSMSRPSFTPRGPGATITPIVIVL